MKPVHKKSHWKDKKLYSTCYSSVNIKKIEKVMEDQIIEKL